MKDHNSLYIQSVVDSLTQELEEAIESREIALMTGDVNMEKAWDERIQWIVDYCKRNSNMLGL